MRIINIVVADLALEKMKAEENLQRYINSKDKVEYKLIKIKEILKEIVLIDDMILTWQKYITTEDSNNNNEEVKK